MRGTSGAGEDATAARRGRGLRERDRARLPGPCAGEVNVEIEEIAGRGLLGPCETTAASHSANAEQ